MDLKLNMQDFINNVLLAKYPDVTIAKVANTYEEDQYEVFGLTEEDLIALGFEFTDYDISGYIPTYQYNNIFACFIGSVCRLTISTIN